MSVLMLHNCMRFMALVCVGATQPAPHATKVTKGAKQLHAAFTKSFQEIYDLFSALQARQSDAQETLCLSDEELARLHAAYKSVHGLMDPAAAGYLFTQVDDELMHSFLGSCAQQALTGVGAQHDSLLADVRSWALWPFGRGCTRPVHNGH